MNQFPRIHLIILAVMGFTYATLQLLIRDPDPAFVIVYLGMASTYATYATFAIRTQLHIRSEAIEHLEREKRELYAVIMSHEDRDGGVQEYRFSRVHVNQQRWGHHHQPSCDHSSAEDVTILTGEVVARWCVDCATQIPTEYTRSELR